MEYSQTDSKSLKSECGNRVLILILMEYSQTPIEGNPLATKIVLILILMEYSQTSDVSRPFSLLPLS